MAEIDATAGLIRAIALLVPAALAATLLAWRRPQRALAGAAVLATAWNFPALLAVNVVAERLSWWHFTSTAGVAAGVPVDLLVGWMLLWGCVPVLASPRGPLAVPVAALCLLDLAVMPLAPAVVELGDGWLVGEAAAVVVALVPAVTLGRMTHRGTHLGARVAMQVILAGALVVWVIPLLAVGAPAGLLDLLAAAAPAVGVVAAAGAALAALVGVAAVQELAERGGGTPVPYDPPPRLVTSGPYAYVANPMQASVTVMLAIAAAVAADRRLAMAVVVAAAYGAGLAAWHEDEELGARFGRRWWTYRRAVPAWWPSWRPRLVGEPATLWVGATCAQCVPVARFLAARNPVGLRVRAAEDAPGPPLRRLAYEAGGCRWQGIAAVARALPHINLAWALVGWALRLPLIVHAVQLLTDAAGGGPRALPARGRAKAPA